MLWTIFLARGGALSWRRPALSIADATKQAAGPPGRLIIGVKVYGLVIGVKVYGLDGVVVTALPDDIRYRGAGEAKTSSGAWQNKAGQAGPLLFSLSDGGGPQTRLRKTGRQHRPCDVA